MLHQITRLECDECARSTVWHIPSAFPPNLRTGHLGAQPSIILERRLVEGKSSYLGAPNDARSLSRKSYGNYLSYFQKAYRFRMASCVRRGIIQDSLPRVDHRTQNEGKVRALRGFRIFQNTRIYTIYDTAPNLCTSGSCCLKTNVP